MKDRPGLTLLIVIILTLTALWIALPDQFPINLDLKTIKIHQQFNKQYFPPPLSLARWPLKTGLDIQGGSHLLFVADMKGIAEQDRVSALESTKDTIERRVNLLGVSEALVQTAQVGDQYRLIVELPGVSDVTQAVQVVGQTAQLDFRRLKESSPSAQLDGSAEVTNLFESTGLTGKDLVRAQVQFDRNTGEPVVGIEFNSEGTQKFAQLTTELVGKQLAIFLDNQPVSAPVVKTAITTGQAIITGNFTLEQAKQLAIQLNAGALPVPIELVSQRTVGATLGQDTINKSIIAGLIGLGLVIGFMFAYYGWLGLLADIGLIIYGILTLALYKLMGVTLTLPGIAGFILSVGMAVDANILIFERYKEEIRMKRPVKLAMELAFGRALDSIRDANVCTLIACFVLFNPFNWAFLNTSGPVRGFALTLGLGIFLGLFTGIIVTRSLIRVLYVHPTAKT